MLDELDRLESADITSQDPAAKRQRLLYGWQRALADSRWAHRIPVAVEQQILVALPGMGGAIINGKLDAVFAGRLDEPESHGYTVVDWKTGRKPKKPEEIEEKLIQLDLYRLLLATLRDIDIAHVDATLYYVSEADESLREIHAEPRSRDEIIERLAAGIPTQSDED